MTRPIPAPSLRASASLRELPILFSGDMVRAILAGWEGAFKTHTRRPTDVGFNWIFKGFNDAGNAVFENYGGDKSKEIKPMCRPGDVLYVRETWRVGAWNHEEGKIAVDYMADNFSRREWLTPRSSDEFNKLRAQSCADAARALGYRERYKWEPGKSPCRWRPSIHMPRWAARIFLRVKSVSVEWLPGIENDDVKAEGIPFKTIDGKPCFRVPDWEACGMCCFDGNEIFRRAWTDIYGLDAWPKWGWKIEFERIENYSPANFSRGGAENAEANV